MIHIRVFLSFRFSIFDEVSRYLMHSLSHEHALPLPSPTADVLYSNTFFFEIYEVEIFLKSFFSSSDFIIETAHAHFAHAVQ